MDSEVLLAFLTLVTAILTPVVTYRVGARNRGLQAVFRSNRELKETELTFRNTSDKTIFLDRVELYQSQRIYFDISDKLSMKRIPSGESISCIFVPDELESYVAQALKMGQMSRLYRKYGSYRMGFKLVLESSEGNIATAWFKIGNKFGFWSEYDYMFYGKSFYPFRTFYDPNVASFGYLLIILVCLSGVMVYVDWHQTAGIGIILLSYAMMIVQAMITSAGGFKNNHTSTILGFVMGLPLLVALYLNMPEGAEIWGVVIIYFMATGYHCMFTSKMSGWNL